MATRPDYRARPWSILIFQVSSRDRQQRILQAFRDIDRPGVLALGGGTHWDPYLVVESPSVGAEGYSKRVVFTIDPAARDVAVTPTSAPAAAASLLLSYCENANTRGSVGVAPEARA